MKKQLLSIVVPVFNEEESIEEAVRRLLKLSVSNAHEVDVELVFVDDGSRDASLVLLRAAAKNNNCVKIISFSRNFGHQIAITAGIDMAKGDFVAVLDADLQDPPELIIEMFKMAQNGFDVVYGKRRSRAGETLFKKTTASAFYCVMQNLCETDVPRDAGDFRLMSRRVVDVFKQMRERHRFVRGMVPWLGFKSTALEYDRAERYAGNTKYPLKKMLLFATNAILSFSSKPLTLAIRLGLFVISAGVVGGVYVLYLKFFTSISIPGVTAILLSIVIFGGVQIFLIGLVGEYIARIFEEIKGRPLYVVEETVNI